MKKSCAAFLLLLLAEGGALADERPTTRAVHANLGLNSSTKNVSIGVSACYLGYVRTDVGSDFLMSAILAGFDHDDLDSLRLSASQTVGVRVALGPWRVEKRCAPRPRVEKRTPDFVTGLGLYGVSEFDSVTQAFRTGHAGLYLGWSVGAFAGFVFNDVTLTLVFRPFEQTAYYLASDWDSTEFRFNNPTMEVELTYVLPW